MFCILFGSIDVGINICISTRMYNRSVGTHLCWNICANSDTCTCIPTTLSSSINNYFLLLLLFVLLMLIFQRILDPSIMLSIDIYSYECDMILGTKAISVIGSV